MVGHPVSETKATMERAPYHGHQFKIANKTFKMHMSKIAYCYHCIDSGEEILCEYTGLVNK
jgi:hypothetical protein